MSDGSLPQPAAQDGAWWRWGAIYQIYPRSFQDSNGDGIGDLAGIAARLDYLVALGVTALWLSPVQPSPMADFGYDVADYCGIDPRFGTLDDFDALVAAVHARGLKLILDFVPNHSSDRHPWFLDSRSSRDAAKRDWYIWRDPKPDGSPPNNWLGNFGGSSWTLDPATGQYYLHSFLAEQPDLNWRNPAVKAAMLEAMRFWLRRGVDGFRVDVVWLLIKDEQLRDNPVNPLWTPDRGSRERLISVYDADQPETMDIVAEMRAVLDSFPDRLLIGEIYLPVERLVAYYGKDLRGAQMPYNFQLIGTSWNAETLAGLITRYEAALPTGAWPNWVLSNHDQSRIASRVGPAKARLAAMLLLTLRGTPTIYYGEEIGMTDVAIPEDRVQDPAGRNQPGLGLGRDPERTPLPWDGSPGGGFTTGAPWLPLGPDHAAVNVAAQESDPGSMLAFYRRLLTLRRDHVALHAGDLRDVAADGGVLSYRRHGPDGERFLILLNFGAERASVPAGGVIVFASDGTGGGQRTEGPIPLEPDTGVIVALTD